MQYQYFRENAPYSFFDIKKRIEKDESTTSKIIGTLKKYNILKIINKENADYSELSDLDIIYDESNGELSDENCYIFTFVGIILLDECVMRIFPKYFEYKDERNFPLKSFKTIMNVIEKYNQKRQEINMYDGSEKNKTFNLLALSLHIINDYLQNGLYTTQKEIILNNNEGEILWENTINENFVYLQDDIPYYLDFKTVDKTYDNLDFFHRLHFIIVSECYNNLAKVGLTELLEIPYIESANESLSDFAEKDFIKYRLENEIKDQFITRKKKLLKTLYTYISKEKSNKTEEYINLFGTTNFNLIWEKACADIFNNEYNNIKEYIEKPEWILEGLSCNYSGDLIPDILCRKDNKFYILDGKYYLIQRKDNKLKGNPGIQDIIKQYIYNYVLYSYIINNEITEVANAFLIPQIESPTAKDNTLPFMETENIYCIGQIPFWSIQHKSFSEFPTIQLIKLNADYVWKLYLSNKKLAIKDFSCIQTSPTKNYLYNNENKTYVLVPHYNCKRYLVGFLNKKYFNFIKNNRLSEFVFYFYASDHEKRYPLHPYIDFCTEFIGYTEEGNSKSLFINGELELYKNGRCKIQEITKHKLKSIFQNQNISFDNDNFEAMAYYKIQVKDCTFKEEPNIKIKDLEKLQYLCKSDCLNNMLFSLSPKVIEIPKN